MKDKIAISIELDDDLPLAIGQQVRGQITLLANENVEIEYLDFRVIREIRGLTSTKKNQITGEILTHHLILMSGKNYVYPFDFINGKYETFKGRNVEVIVKMEANVKLVDEHVVDHLVSRLGFTAPNKRITTSEFLQFKRLYSQNQVKNAKYELVFQSVFKHGFGIFIGLVFLMGILISKDTPQWLKMLTITLGVIALIIGVGYSFLGKRYVGGVTAELERLEKDGFRVNLTNTMNWQNISKTEVSYKVVEEVVDDRGTSETKHTDHIYNSSAKVLENPSGSISVDFNYPNRHIPFIKGENVRVFWLLEVKTYIFWGIEYSFEQEIAIQRSA